MNKTLKIVLFGFLVWLIPSLITLASNYFSSVFIVFEIISGMAIAVTVITFSYLYLMDINVNYVKEGVLIGVIWLLISIILDLLMIIVGITELNLNSYLMYVAPLYIIIPAITIGLGFYLDKNE